MNAGPEVNPSIVRRIVNFFSLTLINPNLPYGRLALLQWFLDCSRTFGLQNTIYYLSGKLYKLLRNDENGSMPLCLLTQNHYGNIPVESCHTLSNFPVVFVGNAVVNEHVQSIQRFTRYLWLVCQKLFLWKQEKNSAKESCCGRFEAALVSSANSFKLWTTNTVVRKVRNSSCVQFLNKSQWLRHQSHLLCKCPK